jgi:hypothetical protein
MSEKVKWTLNVNVLNGPTISESDTLTIDAYDKIEVVVAAGAASEDIQIQPGDAGQVQFLLISSDQYSEDLSYSVNAAEADPGNRIKLDTLQLLIGDGAVGLLSQPPNTFFFYNQTDKDASIQILVGRNATT